MQCYNADKTCIIQERDIQNKTISNIKYQNKIHVGGLKLKIVKYVIKIKIWHTK